MRCVLCAYRRHWHIPAPSHLSTDQLPLLKLSSMVSLPGQSRNLTFDAHCKSMCGCGPVWVWPFTCITLTVPVRVTMCLAPRHGNRLISWSLDNFIPPMSLANGIGDCYFVFYARGIGEGKFSFWLELKVCQNVVCY